MITYMYNCSLKKTPLTSLRCNFAYESIFNQLDLVFRVQILLIKRQFRRLVKKNYYQCGSLFVFFFFEKKMQCKLYLRLHFMSVSLFINK